MESSALETAPTKPRRKRRWFQFGLRALLALVTLSAILFAVVVAPAERQRRAVSAVQSLGGVVSYEHDGERYVKAMKAAMATPRLESISPREYDTAVDSPTWLHRLLGRDYFEAVTWACQCDHDLTIAGLKHLKGLTGLERLILVNCQLTDADIRSLSSLTKLKSLDLGENTRLSDFCLEHLKPLTALEVLDLRKTHVRGAGLECLTASSLRSLSLNETLVDDAGLVHLKELSPLEYLDLSDTRISGAGLIHLRGLKKLKRLNLKNNPLRYAEIAKLRAALPQCAIEWTALHVRVE